MFEFSCNCCLPPVQWTYETTFSLCPRCRQQRAGKPLPISMWAPFQLAPVQQLVVICSKAATSGPLIKPISDPVFEPMGEPISVPMLEEPPSVEAPNRIVAVEFMNGEFEGAGALNQFVNLSAEEKWLDQPKIPNLDRLGARPRVKVRFERPGTESFTLELLREVSPVTYTPEEQKHEHYRQHPPLGESLAGTTDAGGEKVLSGGITLAAAGGYVYRLRAHDTHGNTVVSRSSLCVWRRIFIQPVVMAAAKPSFDEWSKTSKSKLQAQFAEVFFDVEVLEQRPIDNFNNVYADEEREKFRKSIEKECDKQEVSRFNPRLIILAFILNFAEPQQGTQVMTPVKLDKSKGEPIRFMLEAHGIGHGTYSWVEMGKPEWLDVPPELYSTDGSTKVMDLPVSCLKPEPANALFPKRRSRVVVDKAKLNDEQKQALNKGGALMFKFRYPLFLGGIAMVGTSNLIAVATQMNWQETPLSNLSGFVIHELGHKLGMVPSGTENSLCDLSATATSYERKGHKGPHCHFGLESRDSYLGVAGAKCVMYGAPSATTAFCDGCAAALRKVHLGAGWTPFWTT